ncbi:MAG: PTPA-CTERM sorting domain-containing protein [Leptolyngbyaceae cyanobacterium]
MPELPYFRAVKVGHLFFVLIGMGVAALRKRNGDTDQAEV